MDRRALVFLGLVVVASGCAHTSVQDQVNQGTPSSSGSGLQVATFDVSDNGLRPGQSAIVTMQLRNYHEKEIALEPTLYNTGILETAERSCTSESIGSYRADFVPKLECTWRISVPEDAVQSFESKNIPIKLNLEYQSELSNSKDPVKAHFLPIEDITETQDVERSFSNGEVSMSIATERPVPFEGRTVTITANNAGPGRVASSYDFSYFPEEVFDGCASEKEPIVDQEVKFTCRLDPDSEVESTRNLVVSTSYKYIKAPTLDIRVEDTQ